MATAADLRALEDECPWLREDFRAALAELAEGTATASRQYAAEARLLSRLAGQVPRCPFDEAGSTPWTSFRREVALARKVSDRVAARLIRVALRLTTVLPRALSLLDDGALTVARATAFVEELDPVDDEVAAQVDTELADVVVLLPAWRIQQEVRRSVLRLDPEAAAQRTAAKNAGRGVSLQPDVDDQAVVTLLGPAVPLTRWHATVDARARALKAAGDPRTLDALRFDIATSSYPCDVHVPPDPTATPQLATPAGQPPAPESAPEPASAPGQAAARQRHPARRPHRQRRGCGPASSRRLRRGCGPASSSRHRWTAG